MTSACFAKLEGTSSLADSLDQRLLLARHHAKSQRFEGFRIASQDDAVSRQHWVALVDVRRFLGGLLDGVHLLLAALLIHRANDEWYAGDNVPRGAQLRLKGNKLMTGCDNKRGKEAEGPRPR